MSILHLDFGITKDCKNPESYGEICVKCNKCGRFPISAQTKYQRKRRAKAIAKATEGEI